MSSIIPALFHEAKEAGLVVSALVSITALFGSVIAYHVFYYFLDPHGLKKYPGPFWAKFSDVWLGYQARKGDKYLTVHNLHKKYGTYVRIGEGFPQTQKAP